MEGRPNSSSAPTETRLPDARFPVLCGYYDPCVGSVELRPRGEPAVGCTGEGLGLRRNITGRLFAGTPIAVQPAGTLLMTNELAATVALSPIVTAPMILEWHPT